MWRKAGAGGLALAVVGALLLLAAGPAAAAPELRLSPASGPPGSTFLVTGTGFAPSMVVVHWGDESGEELGRALGPDFALEVKVPAGAPPDPHPVMAVVSDGGSTSTSSVSFQVTGSEPTEPPATTSTTAEEAPVDTTPVTRPSASPPSATGGSLSRTDSVGGGVDGGMADTTGGGEAGTDVAGAPGGGAAGSAAAGATGPAAGDTTTTTAPSATPSAPADVGAAPRVSGAGPGGGQHGTGTAGDGASDASESAVAPRPTSQSAGAVRNPLLLFVGVGTVFAAGVVLAVRNRQRTPGSPAASRLTVIRIY